MGEVNGFIAKNRADVEGLAGNKPLVIINMRIWKHVTLLTSSPWIKAGERTWKSTQGLCDHSIWVHNLKCFKSIQLWDTKLLCFQILLCVCSTLSTICVFQFINLSYRVLILYNCFSRIRKCGLIMRLFSFSHSSNQQHSLNFEDNADGRMFTMWSLGSPSTLNSEVQLFLSFCPSFISRRGKLLYGLENTNTLRNGDSQS